MIEDAVTYVDELLVDPRLRIDASESQALFEAFRHAIAAEASNKLAVALLMHKLGKVQRDIAEGREYALGRAVETHRRAVELFATVLDAQHPASLKSRHALALALLAKGDFSTARDELQAIVDLKLRDMSQDRTVVIQDNPESVGEAACVVSTLLGLQRSPGGDDKVTVVRRLGEVI